MILVIEHTYLSSLQGYQYALHILRSSHLEFANVGDLRWHLFCEVDPSFVVEGIYVSIHGCDDDRLVQLQHSNRLRLDVNVEASRDLAGLYLVCVAIPAGHEDLVFDFVATNGNDKHWYGLELDGLLDSHA